MATIADAYNKRKTQGQGSNSTNGYSSVGNAINAGIKWHGIHGTNPSIGSKNRGKSASNRAHHYVKRTGTPGNYKYYYYEPVGNRARRAVSTATSAANRIGTAMNAVKRPSEPNRFANTSLGDARNAVSGFARDVVSQASNREHTSMASNALHNVSSAISSGYNYVFNNHNTSSLLSQSVSNLHNNATRRDNETSRNTNNVVSNFINSIISKDDGRNPLNRKNR